MLWKFLNLLHLLSHVWIVSCVGIYFQILVSPIPSDWGMRFLLQMTNRDAQHWFLLPRTQEDSETDTVPELGPAEVEACEMETQKCRLLCRHVIKSLTPPTKGLRVAALRPW